MEVFTASVQYDDLKGSVAADDADFKDSKSYLVEKGLIQDNEFVVGVKMFCGEHLEPDEKNLYVSFFTVPDLKGFSNIPEILRSDSGLELKEIQVDMSFIEFFSLFKRFSISASPDGIIEGVEYKTL